MKNLLKIFVSGLFVFGSLFIASKTFAVTDIVITNFAPSPTSIIEGQSATLSWKVVGASSCDFFDYNGGSNIFISSHPISNPTVTTTVSTSVYPVITTEYELICKNSEVTKTTITPTLVVTYQPSDLTINSNGSSQYNNARYPAGNPVTFRPGVWNSIGSSTKTSFYNSYEIISKTARLDQNGNIIEPATIPNTTWKENALITGKYKMPIIVAAGHAVSNFSPVTFPAENQGANGTYTGYKVRFCTDVESDVNESDEGNNCTPYSCWFSASVAKNYGIDWGCGNSENPEVPLNKPNLKASVPTYTPAKVEVGVSNSYTSIISNTGDVSTNKGFSNFFQVTTDKEDETIAIGLDPTTMGKLNEGASGTASQVYVFGEEGTFFVRACADKSNRDSLGEITESDEGDNCSDWLEVIVTMPVDPNGGSISGNDCVIKMNESNCETTLTLNVYKPVTKAPTNVTKNIPEPNTLVVPSAIINTFPVEKPNIIVDYPNTTFFLNHNGETITPNGATINATCVSKTIWNGMVCEPRPDLIASIPSPLSVIVKTPTNFSSTIKNQGSISAGKSFTNLFQTSTLPEGEGTLTDYDVPGMSALAVDKTAVASQSISFETTGTYYIRACADKDSAAGLGIVIELVEDNNCSAWVPVDISPEGGTVGTLSGDDCEIEENASDCETTLTIDIINPITGKETNVTKNPNNTIVVSSAVIPTFPVERKNIPVAYGGTTFFLNHNSLPLDILPVGASCESGTGWDITVTPNRCTEGVANECSNPLATNYPTCTTGDDGKCINEATNPPECTTFFPVCKNSATNYPICTTGDDGKCINEATNPPACNSGGNLLNINFTANPSKIFKGRSSILTWSSNADSCTAVETDLFGEFNTEGLKGGSDSVTPQKTTTYKISCTRDNITEFKQATITVSSIKIIET